jgi:hypothetical protein
MVNRDSNEDGYNISFANGDDDNDNDAYDFNDFNYTVF